MMICVDEKNMTSIAMLYVAMEHLSTNLNFYDNINLSLLEKKLLISVPSEKMEFINMLMYFLRNWNLKNDKYHLKSVGIPQNEFGDQSRLLANFYLHYYYTVIQFYSYKKPKKGIYK